MAVPTTLGQVTGQLGTPLSFLGNIALGTPGSPPPLPPIAISGGDVYAPTTAVTGSAFGSAAAPEDT